MVVGGEGVGCKPSGWSGAHLARVPQVIRPNRSNQPPLSTLTARPQAPPPRHPHQPQSQLLFISISCVCRTSPTLAGLLVRVAMVAQHPVNLCRAVPCGHIASAAVLSVGNLCARDKTARRREQCSGSVCPRDGCSEPRLTAVEHPQTAPATLN